MNLLKYLRISILTVVLFGLVGNAAAYKLNLMPVINGYSNCSWRDNGNGTSTLGVSISYMEAPLNLGGWRFRSRGILFYKYNKNGVMQPSSASVLSIALNGEASSQSWTSQGYVMYYGDLAQWQRKEPFLANIELTIRNSDVKDWPAVSVRAGIFTTGDDVGEIAGAAYIEKENPGICTVLKNPESPPPLKIRIGMTAPDWNLGELPEGIGEKVFSGGVDQLCFTYDKSAVASKAFVINASSDNGIVGNRYRLKHSADASQFVPYSLKLDSGSTVLSLPNESNLALPLNDSGNTCFVPTFMTTVVPTLKDGDYSDVLTFTVVTKS